MRGVNDEYIAGLWKSQFIADLHWNLPDNLENTACFPHDVYLAPSWSWASVEGQVEVRMVDARHVRYKPISTMVAHNLGYSSDMTGQVKSGWVGQNLWSTTRGQA